MDTDSVVAVIAAGGAVLAAIVAATSAQWVARRRTEADRQMTDLLHEAEVKAARVTAEAHREAAVTQADVQRELRTEERLAAFDAIVSRLRKPLLHAAFDLQSRLWNILTRGFVEKFHNGGTDRQKRYVIDNTLFVIAQYFCWIEIIRREVQFLDIGDETLELSKLRNRIYHLWQTADHAPPFMVWAGEQRAIGEAMIVERSSGPDCMGYAVFMAALADDRIPIVQDLRRDIEQMAVDPSHGRARLEAIQRELIKLLELLDPDYAYFRAEDRTVAGQPQA